jgi:hypothetical protein
VPRKEGCVRRAAGDAVELAVDTAELHFFDPSTGSALAA